MDHPTEILMIRHGQTDWNLQKRLQGHSDTPLNENGIKQALTLAQTLRNEPLSAVFSSDLQRAYKTAKEIAKLHNLPVQKDPNLRERCYGAFEGMSKPEIKEQYPESHAAWYAADPDHLFPSGKRVAESIREFHHRAISTIVQIASQYAGKKIALIAHFGIIESAYRASQDMPFGIRLQMPQPVLNTSINRFLVKNNSIELLQWGEAEHLETSQKPVNYYKHF